MRIKFRQTVANGGQKKEAIITLTQNSGEDKAGGATLYQWGHSVGLPGVWPIAEGNIYTYSFPNHPQTKPFTGYTVGDVIKNPHEYKHQYGHTRIFKISYRNLWSADNHTTGYNDNPVVKTVYDPCPVGFHIPASNAFTGFTRTGGPAQGNQINGQSDGRDGWIFNNRSNNPDATIHFPFTPPMGRVGKKDKHVGLLHSGYNLYRTATPPDNQTGSCGFMFYYNNQVIPNYSLTEIGADAIRPVAEE